MSARPTPRALLEQIGQASIARVEGYAAVARHLAQATDLDAYVGVRLLAVGKAAPGMARAAEEHLGDRIRTGLVITKDGHAEPLTRCSLRECAHPVPDERCAEAGRAALRFVGEAAPDELLLVLLSGGASSLLSAPLPGLQQADLATVTNALLRAGASIDALNCLRKHLSATAGGRLAKASTARATRVLAISDVPGDQPEVIASGPFSADPTTFEDCLELIDSAGLRQALPLPVLAHLEAGRRGERPETPDEGARELAKVRYEIVASSDEAVAGAVECASELGLHPIRLGRVLQGEARRVGRCLAALPAALRCSESLCLIAAGETTVRVHGEGKGGRNQELALAAALGLRGRDDAGLLALGTDGSDGPTDAAGAYADGGTVSRGAQLGLAAEASLAANDAYTFFAREGGLLKTGPTGTNVMDLALLWVRPARVRGGT